MKLLIALLLLFSISSFAGFGGSRSSGGGRSSGGRSSFGGSRSSGSSSSFGGSRSSGSSTTYSRPRPSNRIAPAPSAPSRTVIHENHYNSNSGGGGGGFWSGLFMGSMLGHQQPSTVVVNPNVVGTDQPTVGQSQVVVQDSGWTFFGILWGLIKIIIVIAALVGIFIFIHHIVTLD